MILLYAYRALNEMPHEERRYIHFPALARNGAPTMLQLTTPKDHDNIKSIWYVIQNKYGAKELVGTAMPRPVTAEDAAQLMVGAGAAHPSQWVQQQPFDLQDFMADYLPVKTVSKPFIKKEPINKIKKEPSTTVTVTGQQATTMTMTGGGVVLATPYQPKVKVVDEHAAKGRLIKRSLFHGSSSSTSNGGNTGADDDNDNEDDDDDDECIKKWDWVEKVDPTAADYDYPDYYEEPGPNDVEVEYDFEPVSQSSRSSGKSSSSSSSSSSKVATYVASKDMDESPQKKTRARTRNVKYQ